MSYDYSALNGLIIEKFHTQGNFATAMKISDRTLSLKLNNKVPFKQPEIDHAIVLLEIKPEDISKYFFRKKFNEIEQEEELL